MIMYYVKNIIPIVLIFGISLFIAILFWTKAEDARSDVKMSVCYAVAIAAALNAAAVIVGALLYSAC